MDSTKTEATLLCEHITAELDNLKAFDVQVLDVRHLTEWTDTMIIASGRSDRQVRAMMDRVIQAADKLGVRPLGVEGDREAEWVLVDLGDLITHLMLPATREYYQLERLWGGIQPPTPTKTDP